MNEFVYCIYLGITKPAMLILRCKNNNVSRKANIKLTGQRCKDIFQASGVVLNRNDIEVVQNTDA